MGIFQALFGAKTRAFKEYKKRLIQDSLLWAIKKRGENVDVEIESILDDEIESIVEQFIPQMKGEVIASDVGRIPAHSKEIAEKLLEYPPEVGAYMALRTFGIFLARNGLAQAPRANLMLAFESMFAINRQKAEQTSGLLARALCMMDSRKIACSTYSSMVDFKMKSLVRERLLVLNREVWEEFLMKETQRTNARVERLIEEIKDESLLWAYRQRAVETLGTLGDRRAVEPIIALIGDESIHQTAIIKALKKLGGRRAVEALLEFLSRGNDFEQGDAAEALGEMEELRALTPLIEILRENKEYYTRRKAIRALGKLGDKRAIEPLNDTLNEILSDDDIREEDKSRLGEEIKKALENINDR